MMYKKFFGLLGMLMLSALLLAGCDNATPTPDAVATQPPVDTTVPDDVTKPAVDEDVTPDQTEAQPTQPDTQPTEPVIEDINATPVLSPVPQFSDLPEEIPYPDGLIGAVENQKVSFLLTFQLPTDTVIEFYREKMLELGWTIELEDELIGYNFVFVKEGKRFSVGIMPDGDSISNVQIVILEWPEGE